MLHNEARALLVKGHSKTHIAKEIAAAYSVSALTVYRLAQQKRETGSVTLRVNQRRRKRLLANGDIARIDQTIQEQPDITIHELVENMPAPAFTQKLVRISEGQPFHYTSEITLPQSGLFVSPGNGSPLKMDAPNLKTAEFDGFQKLHPLSKNDIIMAARKTTDFGAPHKTWSNGAFLRKTGSLPRPAAKI